MHEYVCFDPDWERLNGERMPRTEDDWWDRFSTRLDDADRKAWRMAESMADLEEFETDEERQAYIEEVYEERLAELLGEK